MFQYSQSTGHLTRDGVLLGVGYSGFGADKNQPNDESVKDLGPIPRGIYWIGDPTALQGGPHGPYVMALTPDETNVMRQRSGFLMHGDSLESPGSASHGCIVMGRGIREAVAAGLSTGSRQLHVVE